MIPLLADAEARVVFQFSRLETLDQWWHWLALFVLAILLLSYIWHWYRRDWVEIPKALGWTLLLLRLAAFLGILFYFMNLEKRTEQKIVRPSRVAVLVDSSLSMNLPNDWLPAATAEPTRIERVVASLLQNHWLEELTRRHEVAVYRFDQPSRPQLLATFPKQIAAGTARERGLGEEQDLSPMGLGLVRTVAWIGTFLGAGGAFLVALGMAWNLVRPGSTGMAVAILVGVVASLLAMILLVTAILRVSDRSLREIWFGTVAPVGTANQPKGDSIQKVPSDYLWKDLLMASGTETRLGEAIKNLFETDLGHGLAGIVLVTDGQNNAGIDPLVGVNDAIIKRVPLFAIGMGSDRNPSNVRVVSVEAPKRVFPGDRFRIQAILQASGLGGREVSVQLRRSAAQETERLTIEDEKRVVLASDEELTPLPFDVEPPSVGDWVYEVKIVAPPEDSSPTDNQMDASVRVILPNSKALIIAGGPTQEYQFVRNLLFRDATVQSHVYLQTASKGAAQESQKLLDRFPATLAEMSEYDAVLAFDADWMSLEWNQIQVLEQWVSQHAGGLLIIAGPVTTPRWAGSEGNGDPRAKLLRDMTPVEISARGTRMLSLGRFEAETKWRLNLAPDASRVDFLQIGKDEEDSKKAWEDFDGVYSYYASYEPKPGALPLAYFSDPSTMQDGKLPIYLASQFYGSGRVVFQGSGEIWRIREHGEAYFDTYYMKLVRWIGQGRLLRDSDRGLLLLDKEEALVGEQVSVRAVLKDEQFQPLLASQVDARLLDPQQRSTPLVLVPIQDPSQPGVYLGQFLVRQVGNYSVQLALGGLANQVILQQQVAVRMPTREIQKPQRNDALLSELCERTSGKYFPTLEQALRPEATGIPAGASSGDSASSALAQSIEPVDQIHFLPGTPDRVFEIRWMASLLMWISGCLSLEWLLRRWNKLA